jgi:hypothetical protein
MSDKGDEEKVIHEIVDSMVDEMIARAEGDYSNPLLPFDQYVDKYRLEVEEEVKEFRSSIRKGYIAILEAIKDKKNISAGDKKKIIKHISSQNINSLSGDFRINP